MQFTVIQNQSEQSSKKFLQPLKIYLFLENRDIKPILTEANGACNENQFRRRKIRCLWGLMIIQGSETYRLTVRMQLHTEPLESQISS